MGKSIAIFEHTQLFMAIEKLGYVITDIVSAHDRINFERRLHIIVNMPKIESEDKPISEYKERTPTTRPEIKSGKAEDPRK